MYRRTSLKFKKSSNFRSRAQRRIGTISGVLHQVSTEVLFDSGSSDVESLASSQSQLPASSRRNSHQQLHQLVQPPTARILPGEILLPPPEIILEETGDEILQEQANKRKPPNLSLVETKIVVEEVDSDSVGSSPLPHFDYDDGVSISPLSAMSSSRQPSENISSNASQMSFIIREKLHEFAKDLRRRTSAVRDEVIREPTPTDEQEEEDGEGQEGPGGGRYRRPEQASLMSLIGLHQETEPDETVAIPSKLLPSYIETFSKFYVGWLSFVLVAFLYNAFVIPLRCSYPYQVIIIYCILLIFQTRTNLRYWLFCDYTCDLIYLADLLLIKPRLTFMRDGITVKEPAEMLHHYLASGVFKLDLLALLPLDLFYFLTGPISGWRVFRLLKLPSFWEFFDLLDSSFSNPYAVRIAKTFCYMIYIIHCNSCVYYVLSAWQGFGQIPYNYQGKWYLNKWVYNNEGNAYIRCFYFTAAVATSTGNNPAPTNVIEYIYMTFSWMMGVFVFALLLGQIRDIVSNANKNNEEFRTTMDKALSECKRLGLPEQLTARVRSWFLYTWEQQRTLEEKKLVEKLPLKLQTDLALSVHYNTLSKVKLFQDADRAFLRDLVLRLRPVIFLPGDMICRKGDVGKEMYIVNNGILEVVGGDNNEQVFATLTEGSVFGEISLLAIGGNNRRTANIRSKGYSTLFVLSKEDLNDVIKDYPDAQQLLKKKARQILRKDQKGAASAEEARKNLIERCRVSCDIRTPRMLAAVAKLLPPQSKTTKQLETVLSTEQPKELPKKALPRLKRWSTIPDEFSDVSEMDSPPTSRKRNNGGDGDGTTKRPTTSHSLK